MKELERMIKEAETDRHAQESRHHSNEKDERSRMDDLHELELRKRETESYDERERRTQYDKRRKTDYEARKNELETKINKLTGELEDLAKHRAQIEKGRVQKRMGEKDEKTDKTIAEEYYEEILEGQQDPSFPAPSKPRERREAPIPPASIADLWSKDFILPNAYLTPMMHLGSPNSDFSLPDFWFESPDKTKKKFEEMLSERGGWFYLDFPGLFPEEGMNVSSRILVRIPPSRNYYHDVSPEDGRRISDVPRRISCLSHVYVSDV